jgi:hypothetical protein
MSNQNLNIMETRTKTFPEQVTLDRVFTAYNGKVGCMCGCNGNYAYASQHAELASKDRGYEVTEDEISDNKIKRRFNTIKKFEGEYIVGETYVYIEENDRCFAIYFK